MNHVVPPSSFTTGMMDVEEQSFTWNIENFSVIRNNKSMIDAQKIYFSAGSRVGHPSKWSVYLEEKTIDKKKWISIWFHVEKPSASDRSWKNVFAEMAFDMEGALPIHKNTGQKEVATFINIRGWGYDQFISAEATLPRLVIKSTFKLYVPKSTEAGQPTVKELQVKFATQVKNDWGLLLKHPVPGNEIKLISKDKKEFSVQKLILEVQSPVLKSMMKNDTLKANSGVIQLPDISSRGLEVLLTFLSTGEFHPDWSDPKIVVELTNTAAKYQLQDLLKFLDETLGKICKVENVLALFTLAHDHSLKKAEVELLKFIQEKGSSSPEVYSKILNGISVPGGKAAVVTLPKEKSRWTLGMLFTKNGKKK